MTRRLVIGKFNDGVNFGLRCSLPGVDALTADSSSEGFSFDSSWSDISQALLIGAATSPPSGTLVVSFPNQGYIPFAEIRKTVGNAVYDDASFGLQIGIAAQLTATTLDAKALPANTACIYIIHKIPVMSG